MSTLPFGTLPRTTTGAKLAGIFRRGRLAGPSCAHDATASSPRGALSVGAHDGARASSPRSGALAWAAALGPGRFVVELDGAGQLKSAHALVPLGGPAPGTEDAPSPRSVAPDGSDAGAVAALAGALAAREAEVQELRRRLAALTGGSGLAPADEGGAASVAQGPGRSSDGSGADAPSQQGHDGIDVENASAA